MTTTQTTDNKSDAPHTCERCGESFYYSPSAHRCPGEWEAAGCAPLANPYADLSWVDECMKKVGAR